MPVDLAAACVDAATLDIHVPMGGALSLPADRGRVLGCVKARSLAADALEANFFVDEQGITPVAGMEEYIIQYVSEGPVGVPRRVTAVVAIPSGGGGPFPVVAWAHGTTGYGPACGVSRDRWALDYVMMPLVASGYAVVATDYANLGVPDGVSPYAVGEGQAFNVLDSVRALRALDDDATGGALVDDALFFAGHSQGGHAALWAQQVWERAPIPSFTLLGTVPIAPAFGIPTGMGDIVAGTGATDFAAAFGLIVYDAHAAWAGIAPDTWLQPGVGARYRQLADTLCSQDLYNAIPVEWPTKPQLFQDAFREAAATCAFDGSACPGFQPWASLLYASTPGYFTSSVPVQVVQGGADTVVHEFTVGCIHAALQAHGTPVRSCRYAGADHINIVARSMPDILAWMASRLQGDTPDVCAAELDVTCVLP